MPVSFTLKDIPDDHYQRLEASTEKDHRNLNSDILVHLEAQMRGEKRNVRTLLERAQAVRESLLQGIFKLTDITTFRLDDQR